MMPTNVAARMTLAADPGSLQGAVAAGILGAGPVVLGTSEECARLLDAAQASRGGEPAEVAREIARTARRRRCPASAIRCTGRSTRAPSGSSSSPTSAASAGRTSRSRARFRDAVAEAWGKPLTMNVSMPIAAVLLDLGFPADAVKAVPILARTAGLLAHLAEEREQPIGFLMAGRRGGGGRVRARRVMLEPEVETRPWDEQLALDDASYRAQLAYLLERSPFYREKLARARRPSGGRARGHRRSCR